MDDGGESRRKAEELELVWGWSNDESVCGCVLCVCACVGVWVRVCARVCVVFCGGVAQGWGQIEDGRL
jgi:hypothetical protein